MTKTYIVRLNEPLSTASSLRLSLSHQSYESTAIGERQTEQTGYETVRKNRAVPTILVLIHGPTSAKRQGQGTKSIHPK
jgi:hypothetical protein